MRATRYLIAAALSALLAAPVLAQTQSPSSSTTSRPSATMPNSPSKSGSSPAAQQGGLVDINSASAEELDKLPGIGKARAQAIIANRPYRSKDELAQRKIVPEKVYDQIKNKIVARQGTARGSSGSSGGSSGTTQTQ